MRVLTLDASLQRWSAALLASGTCLECRSGDDSRKAASGIPHAVQALLHRHGTALDAVAVTVGPGSFTGLRAALSVAHGIGLGASVPVVGVTVAEALLAGFGESAWVAIDARRAGRVFLGRDGSMVATTLDRLPVPDGPVCVIGDAAGLVVAALQAGGADARLGPIPSVDPVALGRVALRRLRGALPSCPAQPLYIDLAEVRRSTALRPAPV